MALEVKQHTTDGQKLMVTIPLAEQVIMKNLLLRNKNLS